MSKPSNTINKLIDISEDARRFYMDAVDRTDNPEMKQLFRDMADIRKGIIIDLRQHMRSLGEVADEADGTFIGKANQFIGEKVADMTDNVDEALITYLEEAEDRCLHSFEDSAQDNDLPAETRNVISMELQTLQKTHDHMKSLKDAAARAA